MSNHDELQPGDRLLWLNRFGEASGEPVGILPARYVGEAMPVYMNTDRPQRMYEVMVPTPFGYDLPGTVRAVDTIANPPEEEEIELTEDE